MVELNTQTPAEYQTHAKHLASISPLTEKQAEAYLLHQHATEDTPQKELADKMGITPGTFSNHLSTAKDTLNSEEHTAKAIEQLLVTTPIGAGNTNYELTLHGSAGDVHYFLLRNTLHSDSAYPRYTAVLVYRERGSDHLGDDAPDDIIHYSKWVGFNVHAEDSEHLERSLSYYLSTIDSIDSYKALTILRAFKEEVGSSGEHTEERATKLLAETQEP